jgi:hypothetical protein
LRRQRKRPFIILSMNKWLRLVILLAILSACSRPPSIPTPQPVPTFPPPEATPNPITTAVGEWHLSPDLSPHSYQSTTTSRTKSADQANTREYRNQIQSWFTLSINSLQKPIAFSGSIDSARLAGISDTRFPIPFTGSLNSHELQLIVGSPDHQEQCLSKLEPILGDIRAVISTLLLNLKLGATWADSLETTACSGNRIPTTVRITRQYTLGGTKETRERQVLAITRVEKTQMAGDGSQDQHQVHLEGEGTTTSELSVDAKTGLLIKSESTQQLNITIRASGRAQGFVQLTNQVVDLIR